MSQLVLRESSNDEGDTSSDNEMYDEQKDDNLDYVKQIALSNDPVDKKLIDMHRIRRANLKGINLGYKVLKTAQQLKDREFNPLTHEALSRHH